PVLHQQWHGGIAMKAGAVFAPTLQPEFRLHGICLQQSWSGEQASLHRSSGSSIGRLRRRDGKVGKHFPAQRAKPASDSPSPTQAPIHVTIRTTRKATSSQPRPPPRTPKRKAISAAANNA